MHPASATHTLVHKAEDLVIIALYKHYCRGTAGTALLLMGASRNTRARTSARRFVSLQPAARLPDDYRGIFRLIRLPRVPSSEWQAMVCFSSPPGPGFDPAGAKNHPLSCSGQTGSSWMGIRDDMRGALHVTFVAVLSAIIRPWHPRAVTPGSQTGSHEGASVSSGWLQGHPWYLRTLDLARWTMGSSIGLALSIVPSETVSFCFFCPRTPAGKPIHHPLVRLSLPSCVTVPLYSTRVLLRISSFTECP